jgi:hypothetical protein
VEQEFNRLAQENAALSLLSQPACAEPVLPNKDDSPERASRRQDGLPPGDDTASDNESPALTETPRRPKPTTLEIPTRRALRDLAEEDESPDTPSYSSRPLPLSPRGPKFANIPLRRVARQQHSRLLKFSSKLNKFCGF